MSAPGPCILSKSSIHPVCGFQQITLWWSRPTTGTFDSFVISLANTPVLTISDPTAFNTTITGLQNATDYQYSIQARNSGTLGPSVSWRSVQLGNRATAPQNVSLVINEKILLVSWVPPVNATYDNTAVIRWYVVNLSSSSGSSSQISIPGYLRSTTIPITDINLSYTINVVAVNDVGWSPPTSASIKPTTGALTLWLDMSDSTKYTTNIYNNISTIIDKSGNNNTMYQLPPNSSALPTLGSTIYGLTTAYFSAPAGITQPNNLNGITDFFWVGRQYNQIDNNVFLFGDNTYNDWNGSTSNFINSNGASGIRNASSILFYNGISTVQAFNQAPIVGNASTFLLSVHGIRGNTRFQGLCYDRNNSGGWVGDMGEIMCYSSTMTQQEITTTHQYLLNKWQIIPSVTTLITPSCVNPSMIVAAGLYGSGSDRIINSYNGSNWSGYLSFTNISIIYGIIWNSSLWIAVVAQTIVYSYDLINWTIGSVPSTNYYSIAGNTQISLLGGTGRLMYSYNGITWINSTNGSSLLSTVYAFAYNGSMWVAVGNKNSNSQLIWSTDGINWTASTNGTGLLGTIVSGAAVVWSSALNLWIAGGGGYVLIWSSDGKIWNISSASNLMTNCLGLACNESLVVAGGQGGNRLLWSTDGKIWNPSTNGNTIFTLNCLCLNWNSELNLWTAGGSGGSVLARSTDGKTWISSTLTVTLSYIRTLTSRPPITVAYFASRSYNPSINYNPSIRTVEKMTYSQDGINWNILGEVDKNLIANDGYGMKMNITIWNGSMWVGSYERNFYYSTDGITWTKSTSVPLFIDCFSIDYNSGVLVAGCGTTGILLYSPDGKVWLPSTNGIGFYSIISTVYAVLWNGSIFIAGGTGLYNSLIYSTNGIFWNFSVNGQLLFTTVYALGFNGSIHIAGGTGVASLAYSSDGINWRESASITKSLFTTCYTVAWNGNIWVAGGTGGTSVLVWSSDGITWIGSTNGNTIFTSCISVSWNNSLSLWVASGQGIRTFAYSTDGKNWTGNANNNYYSGSISSSSRIVYNNKSVFKPCINSLVLASGNTANAFAYSYDSVSWVQLNVSYVFGNSKPQFVAYNGKMWIAGNNNFNVPTTLGYSYDGIIWYKSANGPQTFSLNGYAAAWNGSLWVAGGNGTNVAAYSRDGITWSGSVNANSFVPPATFAINSIAYGNNLWVATTNYSNHPILLSSDGSNWRGTVNASNIFTNCRGIAYSGSLWVVGKDSGSGILGNPLGYSSDGSNWNLSVNGESIFTLSVKAIGYNNGLWVAGGQGTNVLAWSTDGSNWNPSINGRSVTGICWFISWNGTQWLGGGGGVAYPIFSSSDGKTWRGAGNGGSIIKPTCVAIASGSQPILALLGSQGGGGIAWTSDGIHWNSSASALTIVGDGLCNTMAWNGSIWVAGLEGSTNSLIYSTDGINWLPSINGKSVMGATYGLAWNGTRWIAVGSGGIAYSTNGITWTSAGVTPISGGDAIGIHCSINANLSVACGSTGTSPIAYSTDGITWLPSANGSSLCTKAYRVCYNGSRWVVGTGQTKLIYSSDAITWVASANGNTIFSGLIAGLATNGSIWIAGAVGGTNRLGWSDDGITWSASTNGNSLFSIIYSLTWTGTLFLAAGSGTCTSAYSTDGKTWTAALTNPITSVGRGVGSSGVAPF